MAAAAAAPRWRPAVVEASLAVRAQQTPFITIQHEDAGAAGGREDMSSQGYIIEVSGLAAGIVVREAGESQFQFHSAATAFNALEGKTFPNARAAERAAYAQVARRNAPGEAARAG
jgi:hypothetical protein